MALTHFPRAVMDDLIFYYDALNPRSYPGSGTSVFDINTSGITPRTGTLSSFVQHTGNSFLFNGANTRIDISTLHSSLSNNNIFTCSCWFKPATYAVNQFIWGQVQGNGFTGANELFEIFIASSQLIYAHGDSWRPFATTPPANTWVNATVTKRGGALRHYLNGELDVTSDATTSITGTASTSHIIGIPQSSSTAWYNGEFALAMFYNRDLTAAEVAQNFNAFRGRFGI